ncbi:MAG: NCS2 family permease [Deferribacteraceae bacterium]|nr:NCS2 family permease [Deferribacteraceae bacterium]
MDFLNKYFKISAQGSSIRTELVAGMTTFLTMCYIVVVNPDVLSVTGMDKSAVFVATCIAAATGSMVMGIVANYPIALAPGMGLNAYFTYSVCMGMGVPWQTALACVFLSGILFITFSLFNIREALINALPNTLKYGISAGIGLFLCLIGMKNAGLVVDNSATFVGLGNLTEPSVIYTLAGFILIVALSVWKVRGAVIIGIIAVTVTSIALGHAEFHGVFSAPPSLAPTFMQMDFSNIFNASMVSVIFVFFFVDLFDSSGTLMAVAHRAELLENGKLPRLKKALLADSSAIVVGAALGTSTTAAYVESAAGAAVGGKTGLTAVTVGVLFLLCLAFSPLALSVPSFATAPALIYVAVLMCRGFMEIKWQDITEAVPGFMTIAMMPFTYSVANGIAFGFISYAAVKLLAGRAKDVTPVVVAVALLWIFKFVVIDNM